MSAGVAESTARRLLRVKDTIDRDFAQQWSIEDLARIALLSPRHFRRRFTRAFGEAPRAYLYRRRSERATTLLRTT
ncbi:AraC family transcriptional regulator [Brachybacterium sp. FME24]|uniref:AraC family transcriptional regulator n=1 Tax=Brachybacterium sp. FME24 TaxID=2742605 RepID=UPI001D01B303|nr:AraC family transcriptional regulator [Brachybacterium sp. FME24]